MNNNRNNNEYSRSILRIEERIIKIILLYISLKTSVCYAIYNPKCHLVFPHP